ncbi:MAG: integrin alpha [Oligoflexia bacterium]|nr:integrin alpha [Oligoflexia bacterium]
MMKNIPSHFPISLLFSLGVLSLSSVAIAQPFIDISGTNPNEDFGAALSCRGPRIVVGAPGRPISSTQDVGAVDIYDLASNTLSNNIAFPGSPIGGERFGHAAAFIPDINSDTLSDLAVGAPGNLQGSVYVYTNLATAPTLSISGAQSFERFGNALSPVGDINGDGIADLAISAPDRSNFTTNDGAVLIYDLVASGSPALLRNYVGAAAGEGLGEHLVELSDYNNDGRHDLAASAPSATTAAGPSGLVRILGTNTSSSLIATIPGAQANEKFGDAIANLGDINQDGFDDLAIGAPLADVAGIGVDAGRVEIHSGALIALGSASGTVLCNLDGAAAGDLFGSSVQGLGDSNFDGQRDFAVGAAGAFSGTGMVFFYSFSNGTCQLNSSLLPTIATGGQVIGEGYGTAIAGAGGGLAASCDFNSDGASDFVIAAKGNPQFPNPGHIFAYHGVISPTATPTPVPTAQLPTQAILAIRVDEKGTFTGTLTYDRDPAGQCNATFLARTVYAGLLGKVAAIDTSIQSAPQALKIVTGLPRVRVVENKKPILYMLVRTDCGSYQFNSNVVGRFLNCGSAALPVTGGEWLQLLHDALKSTSSSTSIKGGVQVEIGKVKKKKVAKKHGKGK